MNIAVFASHGGSDLQAIIDACKTGHLNAEVRVVISNNSDALALKRANEEKIPAFHFSQRVISDSEALEKAMLDVLIEHEIHIIFLAGYLKKLSPSIIKAFEGRIFNIHPSLLPKYGGRGMYGLNVHSAVLNANETETGITIHRVDDEFDSGEIVAQKIVPVLNGDTPETLAERVLEQEHIFIVEILSDITNNNIRLGIDSDCQKVDAMKELKFNQLQKENDEHYNLLASLMIPYNKELDEHKGSETSSDIILKITRSMLNMQGPQDRHLELCYDGENLIGFLYGKVDHEGHKGFIKPEYGYIMEFYVKPEYRRKGYGKAIFERIKVLFASHGIKQMYLTADSVTGIPFWAAMGFDNTGEVSPENGLLIFEKNLSNVRPSVVKS